MKKKATLTVVEERKPILVRVDLTADEWTRLRVVALKRNTSPRRVLTDLARDYLQLHDPREKGTS